MSGVVRIMARRQYSNKILVVYEEPAWFKDYAEFDSPEDAKAYAEKLSKKYNSSIVFNN